LAWDNYNRIKNNLKIHHWLNGGIHLVVAFILGYFFKWIYSLMILLTARIFFDSALNYFRGLSLFYVTPTPKSFQDKIEQKVFGKNGKLPLLIYAISLTLCFIF